MMMMKTKTLTLADIEAAIKEMHTWGGKQHVHLISGREYEAGRGHCIECGAEVVCHDR